MFFSELLVALVVGFILVWIISKALGTKGPWDSLLWFFLMVGLFAWVGGVWLRPYGPLWMGIGWVPMILVGLLVAMLLTAASPRNHKKFKETKDQSITTAERTAVGAFFWVLIACLLIFGMGHYYWYPVVG